MKCAFPDVWDCVTHPHAVVFCMYCARPVCVQHLVWHNGLPYCWDLQGHAELGCYAERE